MQLRSLAVVVGVGLVGALAVVVLPGTSGCSFDNPAGTPDTALPSSDDTGSDVVETGPAVPTVVDPVSKNDIDADLSCLGKSDAGAGDAAIDDSALDGDTAATGQLIPTIVDLNSFNEGQRRLPGAQLELFYRNTFVGADADVTGVVTDDAGNATAPMPANLEIAYRIVPKDDPDLTLAYVPYFELDQLVPSVPNTKMQFFGMTKEVYQSLALAIASTKDYVIPTGTGIVSMRIADCQRRYMRNLAVQLLDVTDGTPTVVSLVDPKKCTTGTCMIYLSDLELPSSATTTSRSGLIAMVNLATNKKYRVVAHGYLNGDPSATIAWRDLEIVDGAITVEYALPR